MSKKYANLVELAAAFKSGELAGYKLILDNDDSFLAWDGENPHEEGTDEYWIYRDEMTDKARDLYRGNGYSDLSDACTAAGIPNEWV